jgi:hypothetical protein
MIARFRRDGDELVVHALSQPIPMGPGEPGVRLIVVVPAAGPDPA